MADKPLFDLGFLTATPGALLALRRTHTSAWSLLARHITGDWGDLDAEDKAENDFSVREGFRILSAYHLPDGTKVWLITEADRSVTTILLPEEY